MPNKSDLFKGLTDVEIEKFLQDSLSTTIELDKDMEVFYQGNKPEYLFILEEGSVVVENISPNGKRVIVNKFNEPGTVLGEVYLFVNKNKYDFSCYTDKKSVIRKIPKEAFLFSVNSNEIKIKIINNILFILANKALYLNKKLLIASSFSIREKLAKFFLQQSLNKESVELNFTREELADFLGATRPSISRELMKMQNDGIIVVEKNNIKINRIKLEKYL